MNINVHFSRPGSGGTTLWEVRPGLLTGGNGQNAFFLCILVTKNPELYDSQISGQMCKASPNRFVLSLKTDYIESKGILLEPLFPLPH